MSIVLHPGSPLATAPVRSLVEAFLAGRNPRTLAAYAADVADFATFVGVSSNDAAARTLLGAGQGSANATALAYRTRLVERGLSPATVNRRLAALRSLVKLARTIGMVSWSLDVESVKGERYRDTRGPGRAGVRSMLDALTSKVGPKGARDRAIVRCLFDLGLRRGEVCSLDVEHLDAKAGTLAILGKGRVQRETLTLPPTTKAALEAWLSLRGATPGPLFWALDRASKGHRLTGTAVYQIVRSLGAEVGLTVRPHGLRHAAITMALDATGGDLRRAAKFSRHRDVRTLTVYDDARADVAGQVAELVASAV